MAGGGKVRVIDNQTGEPARVVAGRLLVSGSGGGAASDVNIDAVGGNPVTTSVPVSGTVTVDSITNPVTIAEPVTVDGTVTVSSITNPVTIAEPVTVDGTVTVSSITNPVTIAEPVTVDGTVTVSSITNPVTIAEPVTVDGTVNIGSQPIQVTNPVTHALMLCQTKIEDSQGVFGSPGNLVAVRAQGDALDTGNRYDAGIVIALPSTSLPAIDGAYTDKSLGAQMLYTDANGNLSVGSFIRGRATSVQRILDIVNEQEQFGSGPFTEEATRGAIIAGICIEDPPADEAASPQGNFGFPRMDLYRRLWVRPVPVRKATYRAATPTYLQTGGATNAIFFVLAGSSTKTIRVQRIRASGMTTIGGEYGEMVCEKWSTAPTGGTAVALTRVPTDSANAAATANLCQVYTAAPTEGTLVGPIGVRRSMYQPITIPIGSPLMADFEWDFRTQGDQDGVVLRGTAECVSLAMGTLPSSAFLVSVEVEWTEE